MRLDPRGALRVCCAAVTVTAIVERLRQWPRGALHCGDPVSGPRRNALEHAVGHALPADYLELLSRFDGLDLRGDRVLDTSEVVERLGSVEGVLDEASTAEAWHRLSRRERTELARTFVPIATDAEGNLKCLDLVVGDVVDVHLESGAVTGWAESATRLVLAALDALELRFDPKGRPRRLKAGEAAQLERRELEHHVDRAPTSAYALLELARWHTRSSPTEVALAAWRRAAANERPQIHVEHGIYALQHARHAEARRALRRSLGANTGTPQLALRHAMSWGVRTGVHALLAELYRQVGQMKKALEQRRALEQLRKSTGEGFDEALDVALNRAKGLRPPLVPTTTVLRVEETRAPRPNDIAIDITEDGDLDPWPGQDQDSASWGEDDT